MHDYLKKYCDIGFRIFPVEIYEKDGKIVKKPLIEGWITKATNDLEEAQKLFHPYCSDNKVCHIGVATGKGSGCTIVDIDNKNGVNGFLSLEDNNITLPHTSTQVSPTGGQHKVFKYNAIIKNSVSNIPGVDVRNDGGFIVIEPSFFPNGTKYEWNIDEEPWSIALAEMPEALVNLLKPKQKELGPSKPPERIKSGQRNDVLFKEGCSLREKGYTESEIFEGLKILNKTRCDNPLPDDEVMIIAQSAGKYEKGESKKSAKKRMLHTLLQILEKDEKIKGLFGFNEFTTEIEFLKSPPWNPLLIPGKTITDTDMISLKVYLTTHHAFEPHTATIAEAIDYEASTRRYHPVRDFVTKLVWDKVPRLDSWLTHGAGCAENLYVKAVSRKVMVGAISRIFNPGCQFDYMLVLEGDQGIGKSTLVNILGGNWFTEMHITEDYQANVDTMRGCWIIEVGEMAGINRMEVAKLRSFITKKIDRVRLAYRRNTDNFPRQSILIGTINPSGDNTWLNDDTGGRRFWPVACTKIDKEWLRANRNQLIAEAFEVYKYGQESLYINDEDVLLIAKAEQAARQQEDIWIQYVRDFIDMPASLNGFTLADLAQKALKIEPGKIDKSTQIRLGIILKKMNLDIRREGIEKIRKYYPKNTPVVEENGW